MKPKKKVKLKSYEVTVSDEWQVTVEATSERDAERRVRQMDGGYDKADWYEGVDIHNVEEAL